MPLSGKFQERYWMQFFPCRLLVLKYLPWIEYNILCICQSKSIAFGLLVKYGSNSLFTVSLHPSRDLYRWLLPCISLSSALCFNISSFSVLSPLLPRHWWWYWERRSSSCSYPLKPCIKSLLYFSLRQHRPAIFCRLLLSVPHPGGHSGYFFKIEIRNLVDCKGLRMSWLIRLLFLLIISNRYVCFIRCGKLPFSFGLLRSQVDIRQRDSYFMSNGPWQYVRVAANFSPAAHAIQFPVLALSSSVILFFSSSWKPLSCRWACCFAFIFAHIGMDPKNHKNKRYRQGCIGDGISSIPKRSFSDFRSRFQQFYFLPPASGR